MEDVLESLGLQALIAGLGVGGTFAVAIVLGLIGMVFAVRAQRRRLRDPEVRAAADLQADPKRGWVQGATFILQRGWDNAYVDEGVIRSMLQNAWGIGSADELDRRVAELLAGDGDAWTLLRAMLLVRSAVAVGWMTNDASFARCFDIGKRLQQRYPSWTSMAEDALQSRRAWFDMPLDGRGDDEGMKEVVESARDLATTHWRSIEWQLPLDR